VKTKRVALPWLPSILLWFTQTESEEKLPRAQGLCSHVCGKREGKAATWQRPWRGAYQPMARHDGCAAGALGQAQAAAGLNWESSSLQPQRPKPIATWRHLNVGWSSWYPTACCAWTPGLTFEHHQHVDLERLRRCPKAILLDHVKNLTVMTVSWL
jgi:hypothetical protein